MISSSRIDNLIVFSDELLVQLKKVEPKVVVLHKVVMNYSNLLVEITTLLKNTIHLILLKLVEPIRTLYVIIFNNTHTIRCWCGKMVSNTSLFFCSLHSYNLAEVRQLLC